MMRFTYGASVQGTFKPSKGKFMFCAEGSTEFALAEGQAKVTGYFPDAQGHHVVARWFEDEKGEQSADLGYLQLALEVVLYGFAGASAMICVNTHFDAKGGLPALRGAFKEEDHTNKQEGRKKKPGKKDDPMLQGAGVEGSLFAGVKAGCDVKLKLNWRNPEQKNEWRDLAEAGYGVAVAAGAAVEGEFKIEYERGKFHVRAHAGIVAGIGASGTVNCVVNVEKIIELIQFCYTELRKADFGYVCVFDQDAFYAISALISYHFAFAVETTELLSEQWIKVDRWWNDRRVKNAEAKMLAQNIIADSEGVLRYATPEAQGRMLYILSETFWLTTEENQEKAVIKLLSYIQSEKEFDEVCEHMTPDGQSNHTPDDGKARLNDLLDFTQQGQFDKWLNKLTEKGKADPNGPVREVAGVPYEFRSPWEKAKELKKGRFAVA